MRQIITHLRNAQELIFEETGLLVQLWVTVPKSAFDLLYAEHGRGTSRPDDLNSFEVAEGLCVRRGS